MKNILKIISIFFTFFASVSCVVEIEDLLSDNQQEGELVEKTFTASFLQDTKTTLVDEVQVWWEPGDNIIVNRSYLTSDIEEISQKAQFSGFVGESDTYYAVYPPVDQWSGSKVTTSLSPTQTAVVNDLPSHISVAKTDNKDANLVFKTVYGYVSFTVTEKSWELESVKVKSRNGEALSGSFTIDYSDDEPVIKAQSDYAESYVVLMDDEGMEPGNYYIPMIPGTYEKGLTFEFKSVDGKVAVRHISKSVELKRGYIQNIGSVDGLEDALASEREALIAIYKATGGDNWYNNTNWCSDKPLNEWYGVATDDNMTFVGFDILTDGTGPGFVSMLNLSSNNLVGSLPEEIGNLKHLKYLSLTSDQGLSGSLPSSVFEIDSLRFLTVLSTSVSGSIPENVGNAKKLEQLYLSFNKMSGPIPSSLYDLKELNFLRLDWNGFTGEISPRVANLDKLTVLNLEANQFSGSLPAELSTIMNNEDLYQFSIGGNNFTGTIPEAIVNSKSFDYLWPTILNQNCDGGIDTESLDIPGPSEVWTDINGNTVNLSEVYKQNELTVLFLFGAWCNFSQTTTVKLLPFYDAYSDKGLEIIEFGNVDWSWSPRDSMEDIKNRMESLGIKWPVVVRDCGWGPDGNYSDVVEHVNDSKLMGTLPGYPSIVAVDRNGKVVYESVTRGYSGIVDFIASYLGEAEVGAPDLYESTDYSKNGEVVTLQTHSKGNGIDIVFLGDAFVDTDMADGGTYETIMRRGMEAIFSEQPMKAFREYFDVHAVKVVSKHNIISDNTTTALSTRFLGGTHVDGSNWDCVNYAELVEGIDLTKSLVICIMNASAYAGTCYMFTDGSAIAYFPLGYDNQMFSQLLNHEAVGHGFGKLLDEYEDNLGSIPYWAVDSYYSNQSLGWGVNVDVTSDPAQVKWSNFLEDSRYDSEGLGVYEGALTYQFGAYRPSVNSIMRHNTGGFNAPSRYELYRRIMEYSGGTATYDSFVEYDTINRASKRSAAAQSARPNYVEKKFAPTHPPIVINGTWRDAR